MTQTDIHKKSSIQAVLIYETDLTKDFPLSESLVATALQKLTTAFGSVPIYSNRNSSQYYANHDIKIIPASIDVSSCLCDLKKKLPKQEKGNLGLFYGWYPLLDFSLLKEFLTDHERYLAHFSYGENIPIGFLPDLLSLECLHQLPEVVPEDIRAFLIKNIEIYDINVFYKEPDLRQYRLDFSTQSQRSQKLATQALDLEPVLSYKNIDNFIKNQAQILRPYPSYFEIELSTVSSLKPFYWPSINIKDQKEKSQSKKVKTKQEIGRFLDISHVDKLVIDIEENAIYDDVTIALGGLGEPMTHPKFFEIIESFLKLKKMKRLYLETFGLDLDSEVITKLSSLYNSYKIHIIIRLHSLQKKRYAQIHGVDVFDRVYENIDSIENQVTQYNKKSNKENQSSIFPLSFYIEVLRITDNDNEISAYFDRFEKSVFTVIIQKYNRYIDLLPERRVANLNPLHQDFCWHLARDFYLTVGARVPLCKQDPFAERAPSLPFHEYSVTEILQKTMNYHKASVRGEYEKIPMPCKNCDEWYTFNA